MFTGIIRNDLPHELRLLKRTICSKNFSPLPRRPQGGVIDSSPK